MSTASDLLRVLVVRPGFPPAVETIEPTLAALQAQVGGDLECWAIVDHVAIYCNEEGRIFQMPYNRRLTLTDGTTERFYGPILLVGFNEDTGASESLTDADLAFWQQRLLHPPHPEVQHRVHYTRQTPQGRRTRLTLQFDVNGILIPASARTWARSVARDWGEINAETRVRLPDFPGWIGEFSCSGHGGFIVVTAAPHPEWRRFAHEGALVQPQDALAFRNTTVFCFEEDADWAVLHADMPAVAAWDFTNRLKERATSAYCSPDQRAESAALLANPDQQAHAYRTFQNQIRSSLERWRPEWLPVWDRNHGSGRMAG